MTRKEQHRARKRLNKGRYIYGSLGTYFIKSTSLAFKIDWSRDKRVMDQQVNVEGD